jgi:hypothetical protein
MKNIFYVYWLGDPRRPGPWIYKGIIFPYEPFYVGKGKGNQCYSHVIEVERYISRNELHKIKSARNPFKSYKILHILNTGVKPILIKFAIEITEKDSFIIEKELISKIGRANKKLGPLTNLSDGGEGNSGVIYGEDFRQMRRRLTLGKKQSAETIAKRSATMKGRKRSPDVGRKVSKALTGRTLSKKHRETMSKQRKGKPLRESHRLNVIKSNMSRKGIPCSETRKINIGLGNKGKVRNADWSRKQSESHKGQFPTKSRKWWKITDPMGKEFIIFGLKGFCDENHLYYIDMVYKGHTQGWICNKLTEEEAKNYNQNKNEEELVVNM